MSLKYLLFGRYFDGKTISRLPKIWKDKFWQITRTRQKKENFVNLLKNYRNNRAWFHRRTELELEYKVVVLITNTMAISNAELSLTISSEIQSQFLACAGNRGTCWCCKENFHQWQSFMFSIINIITIMSTTYSQ